MPSTAATSSRATRASMRGARDGWRTAVEMSAMYTWSFSGATGNRRAPCPRGPETRNFPSGSEFILQTRLFAVAAPEPLRSPASQNQRGEHSMRKFLIPTAALAVLAAGAVEVAPTIAQDVVADDLHARRRPCPPNKAGTKAKPQGVKLTFNAKWVTTGDVEHPIITGGRRQHPQGRPLQRRQVPELLGRHARPRRPEQVPAEVDHGQRHRRRERRHRPHAPEDHGGQRRQGQDLLLDRPAEPRARRGGCPGHDQEGHVGQVVLQGALRRSRSRCRSSRASRSRSNTLRVTVGGKTWAKDYIATTSCPSSRKWAYSVDRQPEHRRHASTTTARRPASSTPGRQGRYDASRSGDPIRSGSPERAHHPPITEGRRCPPPPRSPSSPAPSSCAKAPPRSPARGPRSPAAGSSPRWRSAPRSTGSSTSRSTTSSSPPAPRGARSTSTSPTARSACSPPTTRSATTRMRIVVEAGPALEPALGALLRYFAAWPAHARILCIDILAAGPDGPRAPREDDGACWRPRSSGTRTRRAARARRAAQRRRRPRRPRRGAPDHPAPADRRPRTRRSRASRRPSARCWPPSGSSPRRRSRAGAPAARRARRPAAAPETNRRSRRDGDPRLEHLRGARDVLQQRRELRRAPVGDQRRRSCGRRPNHHLELQLGQQARRRRAWRSCSVASSAHVAGAERLADLAQLLVAGRPARRSTGARPPAPRPAGAGAAPARRPASPATCPPGGTTRRTPR